MKDYILTINGLPHVVALTAEAADRLGARPAEQAEQAEADAATGGADEAGVKQGEAKNKARAARNKAI